MTKTSSTAPTALITGASSGIGASLARCFASAGHDLILVARSADKLQTLADELSQAHRIQVRALPADLALPDAAARLHADLEREQRAVDVLVNCAGVLEQSTFANMTPAQHQQIIDLNISALTAMLAHFVPPMVQRGRGRVLNVASIAAFQPVPTLATYAASKAYVLSLSEAMAVELAGSGVSITALCPGITATPMMARAADANARMSRLPEFLVGTVDPVARQGFEACMRGDTICVPGAVNRATVTASRASPKWLVRRIGAVLSRALS